ncbi:ADAMTS9 [Branchiostoma lanceolatum]|uniref:ADAMTS9 protein n=1 Tax=Branchiostoma lanceolatum TaxID=7740 RepID=A0A8J9V5L9_BRALA|nr:ADAMTS9 [Branchiostoma lanceolatum]
MAQQWLACVVVCTFFTLVLSGLASSMPRSGVRERGPGEREKDRGGVERSEGERERERGGRERERDRERGGRGRGRERERERGGEGEGERERGERERGRERGEGERERGGIEMNEGERGRGRERGVERENRYCSGSRYYILRDPWRSVQVEERHPPRRCDNAEGFAKARWYRFAGKAGTAMPTEPPPSDHRCGSDAPVWLNGTNPRYEDGVVRRKACARFAGDVCAWKWTIRVKRCPEGFLIYKLKPVKACRLTYCGLGIQNVTVDDVTKPVANKDEDGSGALEKQKEIPEGNDGSPQTTSPPPTATSTPISDGFLTYNGDDIGSGESDVKVHHACQDYHVLDEPQRSVHNQVDSNTVGSVLLCDKRSEVMDGQWYRFSGEGGDKMPTERPLSDHRCGTHAPVWMKGRHPTVKEGAVTRTVCAFWRGDECNWSWEIDVMACPGDYYVYKLQKPEVCLLAYCTTDGTPLTTVPPPTPSISDETLSENEDEVGSGEPYGKERETSYLATYKGWHYYKVPVTGVMTAANVKAACEAAGYATPCPGDRECRFSSSACVITGLLDCDHPMREVSHELCGSTPSADRCSQLHGVYQFMHKWTKGGACGAESGSWCAYGSYVRRDRYALCATSVGAPPTTVPPPQTTVLPPRTTVLPPLTTTPPPAPSVSDELLSDDEDEVGSGEPYVTDDVGSGEPYIPEREVSYLATYKDWHYFKVPVTGEMTSANVKAACEAAGFVTPCPGDIGCRFCSSSCVITGLKDRNPMNEVSKEMCGVSPNGCPLLHGVYQFMSNWGRGACGVESTEWCAYGYRNRYAFCATEQNVTTATPHNATTAPDDTTAAPNKEPRNCCGNILRQATEVVDQTSGYMVPDGWTMCYIDERDTAYHDTPCKNLLKGIPGYINAKELLASGGNFGCWHGHSGDSPGPAFASNNVIYQSCRDGLQQETQLSAWNVRRTTLGVCIKSTLCVGAQQTTVPPPTPSVSDELPSDDEDDVGSGEPYVIDDVGSGEPYIPEREVSYLATYKDWHYFKVPVTGEMTSANVKAACEAAGFVTPCPGDSGCRFCSSSCVLTGLKDRNPMNEVSKVMCGVSPNGCPLLHGVYQFMSNWGKGACGVESTEWCAYGYRNRYAFCATEQNVTTATPHDATTAPDDTTAAPNKEPNGAPQTTAPPPTPSISDELPGDDEDDVGSGESNNKGKNLALGKTTEQSSLWDAGYASNAVDGDRSTNWYGASCTHTAASLRDDVWDVGTTNPWWYVDLGSSYPIGKVVIVNRRAQKNSVTARISPFELHVGNSKDVAANPKCGQRHVFPAEEDEMVMRCGGIHGRYVGIRLPGENRILTLCEVEVYAEPLLSDDEDDDDVGSGAADESVDRLPCAQHHVIDDLWRHVSNTNESNTCDDDSNIKNGQWHRFMSGRRSMMIPTERPLSTRRCGTHAPVWMKGRHPTVEEGVVTRTACAFWSDDECHWSWEIDVMACPGDYYVYKLQKPTHCNLAYCTTYASLQTTVSPVTTVPVPTAPFPSDDEDHDVGSGEVDDSVDDGPCAEHYRLDGMWRNVNNIEGTVHVRKRCDKNRGELEDGQWHRFSGKRGSDMMIPTERPLSTHHCGTHAPVWMKGRHPTVEERAVTRTACAFWGNDECHWSWEIDVMACPGDYYVYKLQKPTHCNLAYCTTYANLQTTVSPVTTVPFPTAPFPGDDEDHDVGSGKADNSVDDGPCAEHYKLDGMWRNVNNIEGTVHVRKKCDKNRGELEDGQWHRFSGKRGSDMMIPTKRPLSTHRCRTHAPVWMKGRHPTVEEGVVTRTACAFWGNDECHWSWEIDVMACPGDYYVYKLQKPTHCNLAYCTTYVTPRTRISSLRTIPTPTEAPPSEDEDNADPEELPGSAYTYVTPLACEKHYVLDEPWRSVKTHRDKEYKCDQRTRLQHRHWYRFVGEGGDMMPTKRPPATNRCGTHAPVWMTGAHPNVEEGAVKRRVCAFWEEDECHWSWGIYVMACPGGYYVYRLPKPKICQSAYCTTDSFGVDAEGSGEPEGSGPGDDEDDIIFEGSEEEPLPSQESINVCPENNVVTLPGGKKYVADDGTRTYEDAQKECRRRGGIVAIPRSQGEQRELVFLKNCVSSDNQFWLGVRWRSEGWMDGRGTPLGDFTTWAPGEPDDRYNGYRCAHVVYGSKEGDRRNNWAETNCNSLYNYVCEIEEVPYSKAASCSEVKSLHPAGKDGEYTLYPLSTCKDVSIRVYCHNMASEQPEEFLTLPSGPGTNFANIYADRLRDNYGGRCDGPLQDPYSRRAGTTKFSKIRIKFEDYKVKVVRDDFTFANTQGDNNVSYGEAGDCYSWKQGCAKGTFVLDLTGTGLSLAPDVHWIMEERYPEYISINDLFISEDRTVASARCGGWCGHCWPAGKNLLLSHPQCDSNSLNSKAKGKDMKDIYLGCYKDGKRRRLPHALLISADMTADLCVKHCREKGHAYAGTQYHKECWCGDKLPRRGPREDNECATPCGGNQKEMCGGGWRLSVYAGTESWELPTSYLPMLRKEAGRQEDVHKSRPKSRVLARLGYSVIKMYSRHRKFGVDAAAPPDGHECQTSDGASYRGTVAVTTSGRTCQRWDQQTPHEHTRTSANYPSSGLEENFCRNPDGTSGVWCYTTDPNKRWELCDVPVCGSIPENPATQPPVSTEVAATTASLHENPATQVPVHKATDATSTVCPVSGYVHVNGACYKGFAEPKTYDDARQRCAADGGLLAMPTDRATNRFISNLHRASSWLGLTDANSEGRWVFEDGQTLKSSGFANWGRHEPNNADGNEDCAEVLSTRSLWNDVPCNSTKGFTCQIGQGMRYKSATER